MNIQDLYQQRDNFYIKSSSLTRGGIYLCILVGLLTFFGGLQLVEQTRVWGALLFNLLFFFGLAIGGSALSAMQDVIGANWGRPFMRIHEAFTAFLPVVAVMLIMFFAAIYFGWGGAENVYTWMNEPEKLSHFFGKRTWLDPMFMFVRDTFFIVVITWLAYWQMSLKLKRDKILLSGDIQRAEVEGKLIQDKLRHWSGPLLAAYSIAFTFLGFDLTMSLAWTWFSTLWGGWQFSIVMQTLFATLLLIMFALKGTPIGQMIKRNQFHDCGKMMHGFSVFFAYLTYAHILTYWYGNVPEETEYFIHRLHAPWIYIVIATPLMAFVFPLFALLPKVSKWTAIMMIPIASIILFAQWLVALLIVQPEVVSDKANWMPWVEVGMFFGILGLFMASFFWFSQRFPMISIADPLLLEAYNDDH